MSDVVVTTTKTVRARTVTVGAATARLWQGSVRSLVEPDSQRRHLRAVAVLASAGRPRPLPCAGFADIFRDFARRHGYGDVTLHHCGTASRTSWSQKVICLTPSSGSGTKTPRPPCGSTAMPCTCATQDVADRLEALLDQPS